MTTCTRPLDVEDLCMLPAVDDESDDLYPCMRLRAHVGECCSAYLIATRLDGLRWCCRVLLTAEHNADCPRKR